MTCEFVQITQQRLHRDVTCPLELACPQQEICALVKTHESFALLNPEEFARRLSRVHQLVETTSKTTIRVI